MKSGHFIMKLWQTGNIGEHNIDKLEKQPKDGYKSKKMAHTAMIKNKKEGDWELTEGGYTFTILELFW